MKYVIELSDDEIRIVTKNELDEMRKEAEEFDGFYGFDVKGILKEVNSKLSESEKTDTVNNMLRFGGSFVKSLADLWLRGDYVNRLKIETIFSNYFEEYQKW